MFGSTLVSVLMLGNKLQSVIASSIRNRPQAVQLQAVQVNQIKHTLNRRTEAKQLLALLTKDPTTYEMIPQQRNRSYSVVDLLHGAAFAVADVDNATESELESSC